jgi:hypothetical protein
MFVEHPIQDRSDDELQSLAEQALADVVERLTSNNL